MTESHHDDDNTHTHTVLTAGTMVGHYRIVEKIGAGGMIEFYSATDTESGQLRALAILPKRNAGDRLYLAEFTEEAKNIAAMNHPDIKSVSDVMEYRQQPYFVIGFNDEDAGEKYIENIRQRFAEESVPPQKPVDWWNRYVVVGAVIILVIIALLWLLTDFKIFQPSP